VSRAPLPEVRGSRIAGLIERERALLLLRKQRARHVQLSFGEALIVTREGEGVQTEKGDEEMADRFYMTAEEAYDLKMPKRPTAGFVRVTPPLSKMWLERNTRNRVPSQDTVDRYHRTIDAGDWLPTPQGIGFDRNGVLVDGQQRLMAVIASGKSVILLVVWGLDPEVIAVLDEQRRRTAGNLLQISGEENANRRAAVARGIYRIGAAFNVTPSNKEVLDTLDKHRAAVDWITSIQTTNSVALDRKLPGDIEAALAIAWEKNPRVIDRLARDVWDGTSLEKGSPAWVLVRYLRVLQSKEKQTTKLDTDVDKLQKVLRACYAASHGESGLQQLKISTVATEYYLSNRRALLP